MTFDSRIVDQIQDTIKALRELSSADKYEEALELLAAAEKKRGLSPSELASKGRLIQLADSPTALRLIEEIGPAFERAFELDRHYVSALTELAFYRFSFEDDAESALPLFREAVHIARWLLTEAASGLAACVDEIEGKRAARRELLQVHRNALLPEKLDPDFLPWITARKVPSLVSATSGEVRAVPSVTGLGEKEP